MLLRRFIAFALAASCLTSAATAIAQTAQQQPLVQAANLVYRGKFTLPSADSAGIPISYGGDSLGMGADGVSLYYGCVYGGSVARVSIPVIGGVASLIEPCRGVPNLNAINPSDPNAKLLGGVLAWNGRLIVSGYSYYDGTQSAVASHFVGSTIAGASGPYRVGTDKVGFVAGYMGVIPAEWRGLLGGPSLTGQCCLSIISRTSYGPSVSVFDPAQLGVTTVASKMLVGYPQSNPSLGNYGVHNPLFSGATQIGGVAFPGGTRSVLFVGRHGTTYCYGEGTSTQSLHNTPVPGTGGAFVYCYDPTDPYKGTHGYPYQHMVWAYDAVELLAVKQGLKNPWDVLPYATWTLGEMSGGSGAATLRSATYDPATRRWYMVQGGGSGAPTVHVYEVTNAVHGPQGLTVQTSTLGLTFSWNAPPQPGYSSYSLEAGTLPGSANIGALSLAAGSRTVSLPPTGATGTFYIRLKALYPDGAEGISNEVSLTLGATGTPQPPANFRATASGTNIVFSWDVTNDPLVTGVVADAGTAPGLSNLAQGAPIGNSGSYVAANAPPGHYYFRLRAVGQTGSSAQSNEAEITIGGGGGAAGAPLPPTLMPPIVTASRTATLSWDINSAGPDPSSFLLEVGSQPGRADLGTVSLTGERFVAPGVPSGVYFVRVRSANSAGTSAPSNEMRLVVP